MNVFGKAKVGSCHNYVIKLAVTGHDADVNRLC